MSLQQKQSNAKIKLVFIITGLSTGGAEMMLYKLLSRIDRDLFHPAVISLKDSGTLGNRIEALDIPVYTIGLKAAIPTLASIWQLISIVRQLKPNLLQGWMYHGNLAALVVSLFTLKSVPIIWNIRKCIYSLGYEKQTTAAIIKLLAKLDRFPRKILYNSKVSVGQHEKIGYESTKTIVIPNGFDTDVFAPSAAARRSVRTELGLTENTLLIGMMGRYHPMKDHANFLQAAAILLRSFPDVMFVLAGREVNWNNRTLSQLVQTLELTDRVHLLGEQQDMPRLTAALDIATSASAYGEGFANVIGEAMSCGVPCVVTNIGDSAWIVGNTGRVVSPKQPESLANGWKELIELGPESRQTLGQAARTRIIECFSLDFVVAQYELLYKRVLAKKIV